ncbi:TlpA family protein disulfide reductase [Beggiatoa alba]|nr:TlpA family protein disulfide reductase [Beggiatoa alba]
MNKKLLIVIVVFGLITGIIANQYYAKNQTIKEQTSKPTQKKTNFRPDYTLEDPEGKRHSASEWDGKVVIVNFWATWCPPCRREMPAFVEFQTAYEDKGVTFVGIALDEKDAVIDFIDPLGVNYPILIAEQEGIQLSQEYGNRLNILPFTVVIDRTGNIVKHFFREVSFQDIEEAVKPLL